MSDKPSAIDGFLPHHMRDIGEAGADATTVFVEHADSVFHNLAAFCESPIERLFLAALLFKTVIPSNAGVLPWMMTRDGKSAYQIDDGGIAKITPQFSIEKYRCDFGIFTVCEGRKLNIIVECDGHDFHERTKEQAARDKKRDRSLISGGYTVMRFTGSEIWKSPNECATQVADHLTLTIIDTYVAEQKRG